MLAIRSHVYTGILKMEGKVEGKKVETVWKKHQAEKLRLSQMWGGAVTLKAARGPISWLCSFSEGSMYLQVGNGVNGKAEGVQLQVNLLSEMNLSLELSDVISCASSSDYDPWTFTFIAETCHQNWWRVFYVSYPSSTSSFLFEPTVLVHLVGLRARQWALAKTNHLKQQFQNSYSN